MLRLEDVTGLDDHTALALVDGRTQLVVVARDHGLPVHGTPFTRSPSGIWPIRASFKRLLGWPPDEREHTDGRGYTPARPGGPRARAIRGGGSRLERPGVQGGEAACRLPGGGGGSRAADLRARLPLLEAVHARHQPPRVAPPDPHEPEHRPRPATAANAADDPDRHGGGRLLPLQQARGAAARREPRRGARARAPQPGLDRRRTGGGAPRLPGCRRARGHRRVLVRRRSSDPRHPDRHRHVALAPRQAYPEEESRRRSSRMTRSQDMSGLGWTESPR